MPRLETIRLPLQCTELSVTEIPSASNTTAATAAAMAAVSTTSSQCDDAIVDARPANSLHEPSGGPSTSDAFIESDSPSKHALPSSDPGAALPRTATVNSARSSATPQGTSALTHNPSATDADAASSSRGKPPAEPDSQASSEAHTAISSSINTQHNTHSSCSSSSSSSSSSKSDGSRMQETSGQIPHCHLDWDKDVEDSHDVAVNDGTGVTDSRLSNQTAEEAQQKSYVVLSVSLKNGKASDILTALSMSILLQHAPLHTRCNKPSRGTFCTCLAFLKLTVQC